MAKKRNFDIVVIGFMIFATFFGAGNLIFPPYLGVLSGEEWYIAFAGFLVGDVVLSILAVIASCKYTNQKGISVLSRAGEKFSIVVGCLMLACIGPLMSIPRTGATTFEISIQPLFPEFNKVVFSVIFFAVTLIFTIRPAKVVDYVGKFLTPLLLIALAVLIIKGIVSPLGEARPDAYMDNLFAQGLAQGYQTMDAFGGTVIAIIIIVAVVNKGYNSDKERTLVIGRSSIVAGVCLALVYGGLCIVGTTVSAQYDPSIDQTALVVAITNALLGTGGQVLLAIIIALACLTTAVGTLGAVAQFFANVTNNKIKYEWFVIGFCVFSMIISNFGVNTIINFSAPILSVIYPVVVAMIILSIFTNKIKNDNVFRFAAYMALLVSLLTVLNVPYMDKLPFASFGLNWIVPVAIAAVIGFFVPSKKNKQGQIDAL